MMFTERQLERYAEALLWGLQTARPKKFIKKDVILIRYHLPALRLAEILYDRLLDMGLHPVQRMEATPNMEKGFFERANSGQLVFRTPGDDKLYNNLNGSIFLHAPESITHLSGVDPGKIGKHLVAKKYLRDILNLREEGGAFSWTLCLFPTAELATHAKMSLKAYTDQITRACFLNRTSTVSHWQQIFNNAKKIKKWLNGMKVRSYHIESDHTDLRITPGEKRRWIGISGHNIPSFEIFLSPDWRGTEGTFFADQPSYRSGNYVKDVKLEFRQGAAMKIEAKIGETFVKKQLSMDKGANKLGEFSLTDKRFSKIDRFMANTLYDENYGGRYGNCHVALGSSYSDTYDGDPADLTPDVKKRLGLNDSALHWDFVNTENKRVIARLLSGEKRVIYENGMFTRSFG
jgi:aminopeptidase